VLNTLLNVSDRDELIDWTLDAGLTRSLETNRAALPSLMLTGRYLLLAWTYIAW
jgi:hypothetical protein